MVGGGLGKKMDKVMGGKFEKAMGQAINAVGGSSSSGHQQGMIFQSGFASIAIQSSLLYKGRLKSFAQVA